MKGDRFRTEQDYFETNASENENPFDLHYETGSQIDNYVPVNETEQDYFETNASENENPFDLHYLNEETIYTTQFVQPYHVENFWQPKADTTNDIYISDYVQYLYGYKEIPSKSDFYRTENLLEARDFEIFSSEIQDQEFKTVLSEIVDNAENKFEKYMNEKGDSRYFENMLSDPKYGPLAI